MTNKPAKMFLIKFLPQSIKAKFSEVLKEANKNAKIEPKIKEIYYTEAEVKAHLDGYSDAQLNEYIIAKSHHWLESLDVTNYVLTPNLYSQFWVIQLAQSRLGRPVDVIDYGGGAPIIPMILNKLGMGQNIESYKIIENPFFVSRIPEKWNSVCHYGDTYNGDTCDLLILSGVLAYLRRDLVNTIYSSIEKAKPRFIYLGRTSFLSEDYPHEEVYTVQSSRFGDHGAQVDIGMQDIENNMAHYVRRHFKLSEITNILEPLRYRLVLELADDSGLENIKGLGLHSKNSLWEYVMDDAV